MHFRNYILPLFFLLFLTTITAQDIEILSFELNLFDRGGNHLESFSTTNDSWDGKLKDQSMNPGVYVWYYRAVIVACGERKELFRKGDVTLVK